MSIASIAHPLRNSGAILVLAASITVFAQVDTGNLSGAVHDSSGAVIQSAAVRIVNSGTSATFNTTTGENGLFSAPGLRPGKYQI